MAESVRQNNAEGVRDQGQAEPILIPDAISAERIMSVYKFVLKSTFYSSVLVILFLVSLIYPIYLLRLAGKISAEPPFFVVVIIAGALGSLFSSLVRIYRLNSINELLISDPVKSLNSRALFIYSMSSPVIGTIAAAVIYVLFTSELVRGSLFPSFHCMDGEGKCVSFFQYLDRWSPVDSANYGKALMWGFIAGFAERMIPDALTKLSGNFFDNIPQKK